MKSSSPSPATELLSEIGKTEPGVVAGKLLPLVYDELRGLAAKYLRRERKGHTLDPTALVHEAFMKLVDQSRVDWRGKTHFYAVAADAMRRILIDHARGKKRDKRGGGWHKVAIEHVADDLAVKEVDLVDLYDALAKLAELDHRQAKLVDLRLFAGLNMEEAAEVLGVSKRTAEGDWTHAKAWLRSQLAPDESA